MYGCFVISVRLLILRCHSGGFKMVVVVPAHNAIQGANAQGHVSWM